MLSSDSITTSSKNEFGSDPLASISNSNSDPRENIKGLKCNFKNSSSLILSVQIISCVTVVCLYNSLKVAWTEKIRSLLTCLILMSRPVNPSLGALK